MLWFILRVLLLILCIYLYLLPSFIDRYVSFYFKSLSLDFEGFLQAFSCDSELEISNNEAFEVLKLASHGRGLDRSEGSGAIVNGTFSSLHS